jgi:hypothetical protein
MALYSAESTPIDYSPYTEAILTSLGESGIIVRRAEPQVVTAVTRALTDKEQTDRMLDTITRTDKSSYHYVLKRTNSNGQREGYNGDTETWDLM